MSSVQSLLIFRTLFGLEEVQLGETVGSKFEEWANRPLKTLTPSESMVFDDCLIQGEWWLLSLPSLLHVLTPILGWRGVCRQGEGVVVYCILVMIFELAT